MDDLISRQAAIDALITVKSCLVEEEQLFMDCLISDIERLPSAYPKKGRWRLLHKDIEGVWFGCTNCGNGMIFDDYKPYDYCPNCGARMEE